MGIAGTMGYIQSGCSAVERIGTMFRPHSRLSWFGGVLIAMHFSAAVPAAAAEPYDPWPGLVQDIFNNRAMNDAAGVIAIEMPARAEDAAIVPVTLRAT